MVDRTTRLGALVALVCATALAACSGRDIDAVLMLEDVVAGERSSWLKRLTDRPTRRPIAYHRGGRRYRADLYRPGPAQARRSKPTLVLVPGAAPRGRDDPRLRALAGTFARLGFEVLVPEIPSLRRLRVRATDVRHIADAIGYAGSRPGAAGGSAIGVLAISYSVGPAVLAALETDVRDKVGFVVGIGGYYDLTAVVTFFTTGRYRSGPRAPWRFRAPNPYGKWVFALSNADFIESARDRVNLRAIALRKRQDPNARIADLVTQLGPEGARVYALIVNRDAARVPALLAGLPAPALREFRALDLAGKDFRGLRARLILIHGRDDPIVPHTESAKLAQAVGKERASLFIVRSLAHVTFARLDTSDLSVLLRAARAILAMRDRAR